MPSMTAHSLLAEQPAPEVASTPAAFAASASQDAGGNPAGERLSFSAKFAHDIAELHAWAARYVRDANVHPELLPHWPSSSPASSPSKTSVGPFTGSSNSSV